jgi:acyl-coenzyme A thioesterase 13
VVAAIASIGSHLGLTYYIVNLLHSTVLCMLPKSYITCIDLFLIKVHHTPYTIHRAYIYRHKGSGIRGPGRAPSYMASPELDHVVAVCERMRGNSPIYDFLLGNQALHFVSASKGAFKARLKLDTVHVNSKKTIHGSVTATLVDWAGGLAIATHGLEKTGASVDIHVSYISTAQAGDEIEIEGRADKVGRSLAFTSVTITKLVDGKPGPIVATASHTKYVRQ